MSGFFNQEVDEILLAGCRKGDPRAQGSLFKSFSTPVFTLALRLTGSRPLADEVVQDTFVEVLTKINQFRGDAPIGAWIRRIAINKAFAQLRSPWLKRGGELVDEPVAAVPDDSVPLDLEVSLRRLNQTARTVLWLHDVEGYTHKEIAGMMGKTVSFSKSQLSRAHQRLTSWATGELARQDSKHRSQTEVNDEKSCMPLLNS